MNCTMNCSVNWHLTYRDADVSTYSDGHGSYMSIMHDKKTPPNAVEKIGGGSMEIPLIAVPPITMRPIATEKLPLWCNRHIEVLNEHIESDCKRR
ncbi:hypothetical protein B5F14_01695 [Faecalitalea cylindroides]|uniref:Uncharacterized protein n=1 Tax=Faecalitalea cylindroides TaxID=39483 RepID=A0A1Y4LYM5_9FIRM|nr:hypothetical protein B5F14_01695 [Faecalitalea cylindroides]